ncbi:transmembrane protein 41B isoform X1 [Pipra filicauda]|uniref:Transmembrane protein 41B isoform X1 n=1 Tax=Pipra filicauda TaxID=649802 RepID=A0A7R5KD86_9PASS|nr:transmembrane protein 41B isoform X1 [Pipra filicauda]
MAQRRAAERGPCQAAESARHQRQLLEGKALTEGGSARTSLLILVSIFLSAAFLMFLVYKNFPQLSEEERECIKIPRDMDDAKALGKVLSKYKDTFYVQVLVAYFATYVLYPFSDIKGSFVVAILL